MNQELKEPDFWNNKQEAAEKLEQITELKDQIGSLEDIKDTLDLLNDTEITEDSESQIEKEIKKIEKKLSTLEIKIKFLGKYDPNNAIISFHSGAGGIDAQDWTGMLLRMYQRYTEKQGWKSNLVDQSLGEQSGVKSAILEIEGRYAFGYLKNESGVHRLVRISPFSAKKLRHTSFALVEVIPEIERPSFGINPNDLRIDTFRSSGPGGQNVNKLETAVRVTHIPTGTTVSVQSERSQAQNKAKAMKFLYAKLQHYLEKEHISEVSKLKPQLATGIEWGNQIRSYVLHPYKLVKDLRTEVESHNPDSILDGNLNEFVEAGIAPSS